MNRPPRSPVALLLVLAACASRPAPETPDPRPSGDAPVAAPADGAEELGSTRNARVALPMPDGPRPVTMLIGALDEEERAQLERVAPNVRILVGLSREEALERAAEVHAIDARYATPELLARATSLVWVQARSAGVDRYVGLPQIASGERVVLTNLRAVHGPAIADHAFAMLLALTRGLPARLRDQEQGRWSRDDSSHRPIALQDRTLLVVGLGGIGGEIAQRGHGFGMRVVATRRTDAPSPPWIERVGRPEDLLALLPEADVVAICVPLTAETERLFDARAFAALKPGAYLVNIARGRIVDTDALVAALRDGRLAGACLDVTDPEPLPADHPLWRFPNVVITPHVASEAELTDQRAWALLCENVRRFGAGEALLNVVDPRAGY